MAHPTHWWSTAHAHWVDGQGRYKVPYLAEHLASLRPFVVISSTMKTTGAQRLVPLGGRGNDRPVGGGDTDRSILPSSLAAVRKWRGRNDRHGLRWAVTGWSMGRSHLARRCRGSGTDPNNLKGAPRAENREGARTEHVGPRPIMLETMRTRKWQPSPAGGRPLKASGPHGAIERVAAIVPTCGGPTLPFGIEGLGVRRSSPVMFIIPDRCEPRSVDPPSEMAAPYQSVCLLDRRAIKWVFDYGEHPFFRVAVCERES